MVRTTQIFLFLLIIALLQGCKSDNYLSLLPVGFQHISNDNHAHFVYVDKKYWGDKLAQRAAGIQLCTKIFDDNKYCEVYYFSSKKDIPTSFPIVNRLQPIGVFEYKYGKMKLKTLSTEEIEQQKKRRVVFFKYYNRK